MPVDGIHHVTAIASDPQRNLDFYVGLLGLRLIKRTVNFDDPGTYHFYFGDAAGTPGTIDFFPWPGARRGERGAGEVEATAFAIPPSSVGYWLERLQEYHVRAERAPDHIFGSQAACCSKSPRILRGSPRMKGSTNSVRVCACRRGWSKPASRSRKCFQKSPPRQIDQYNILLRSRKGGRFGPGLNP